MRASSLQLAEQLRLYRRDFDQTNWTERITRKSCALWNPSPSPASAVSVRTIIRCRLSLRGVSSATMKPHKLITAIGVWFVFSGLVFAEPIKDVINWPEFLARHDLIWQKLPAAWHEGAFIGNGLLGSMIYGDKTTALRWDIGRRDDAVRLLNPFLDSFVKPNTMYLEGSPVIETPLSGAQSVHDLLLQSWGRTIRIFPGVPDCWKDVTFHNLRAEGAFLVSAVRKDGKTQFIRIKSLAGEPCRLLTDTGVKELRLAKGEETILGSGEFVVAPVTAQAGRCNFYGVKAAQP